MKRLAEADIIRDVAVGDQEALAELYDRYAASVYGLVRRVVRSPSQSEEVAQAVFVEAWRSAGSYDAGQSTVATWLLVIAHRRAIDRVRGHTAREERRLRDRPAMPFDGVAEHRQTNRLHESHRAGLADLADQQCDAIELAYFEGNTYREAAATLRAEPGTVAMSLRNGLLCLGLA